MICLCVWWVQERVRALENHIYINFSIYSQAKRPLGCEVHGCFNLNEGPGQGGKMSNR